MVIKILKKSAISCVLTAAHNPRQSAETITIVRMRNNRDIEATGRTETGEKRRNSIDRDPDPPNDNAAHIDNNTMREKKESPKCRSISPSTVGRQFAIIIVRRNRRNPVNNGSFWMIEQLGSMTREP